MKKNNSPTFEEMRATIGEWLKLPEGHKLWEIMSAQRGPDAPSERPNMSAAEHRTAYAARRKRKYNTVEVIRSASFGGVVGGSARHHKDDHITLPPESQWDHFDNHCYRAANVLGLKVVIEEEKDESSVVPPNAIEVNVPTFSKRVLKNNAELQAAQKAGLTFSQKAPGGGIQYYTYTAGDKLGVVTPEPADPGTVPDPKAYASYGAWEEAYKAYADKLVQHNLYSVDIETPDAEDDADNDDDLCGDHTCADCYPEENPDEDENPDYDESDSEGADEV